MTHSVRTKPAFIRSGQNALLKRYRRALTQGELTEDGCCALEGQRLLEEALRSPGVEVVSVLASESAKEKMDKLAESNSLPFSVTTDRLFQKLTQTETPQGVAALVRLPERKWEDCLAAPNLLAAVLVGLQDPGNLGTILRGLEAFGGGAGLLTPGSVSPYNAKAVRASAGSLFRVPVFPKMSAEQAMKNCSQAKVKCVGLVTEGGTPIEKVDLRGPVAFFVGGEARGLPGNLAKQLDATAQIPFTGPVESLNAAVAASLAFYETQRQRRAD